MGLSMKGFDYGVGGYVRGTASYVALLFMPLKEEYMNKVDFSWLFVREVDTNR